jgi:hypothetical protein
LLPIQFFVLSFFFNLCVPNLLLCRGCPKENTGNDE